MKRIKLLIYNVEKEITFYKYFETEFERDKFARKLKYSKKLKALRG